MFCSSKNSMSSTAINNMGLYGMYHCGNFSDVINSCLNINTGCVVHRGANTVITYTNDMRCGSDKVRVKRGVLQRACCSRLASLCLSSHQTPSVSHLWFQRHAEGRTGGDGKGRKGMGTCKQRGGKVSGRNDMVNTAPHSHTHAYVQLHAYTHAHMHAHTQHTQNTHTNAQSLSLLPPTHLWPFALQWIALPLQQRHELLVVDPVVCISVHAEWQMGVRGHSRQLTRNQCTRPQCTCLAQHTYIQTHCTTNSPPTPTPATCTHTYVHTCLMYAHTDTRLCCPLASYPVPTSPMTNSHS